MITKSFGSSAIIREFDVFRVPQIWKIHDKDYEKDAIIKEIVQ